MSNNKKALNIWSGLLDKYRNISEPVKASVWFTLCSIIQKGIGFLTTPLFTRFMTTEQFGKYSVYLSWNSIIIIFATLNLAGGVYNNALTKYKKEEQAVTSSFLGLSTFITGILFAVYLIFRKQLNVLFGMDTALMIAMFIQLFLEPAYQFWSTKERYNYKYKKLVATTIFITVGSPLLGIIAVLSTAYKTEARVIAYVAVVSVVSIVFYVKIFMEGRMFYNKAYWKYALCFNLPLVPHYLSQTLLNQADRLMIDKMVGSSEAAIYSIAYTVATIMQIVITAINNSLLPYTYKSLEQKDIQGLRKNSKSLLCLMVVASGLIIFLGPEIVYIVGGVQYMQAKWVIAPIALSVYFLFLYSIFANIEFYYEKTKFMMIGSCCCAAVNIILNYIFIPIYGYYAAGYTTLVCYILFALCHYLYYKKIIKEVEFYHGQIYDVRFIILLSLGGLIAMVVLLFTYRNFIIRYTLFVLIFILLFIKRKKIVQILKSLKL